MAEGKWTHLKEILKFTDNGDTLPTNRPLHTTLYFVNLKQNLKKYVWKQPEISKWGELLHFLKELNSKTEALCTFIHAFGFPNRLII